MQMVHLRITSPEITYILLKKKELLKMVPNKLDSIRFIVVFVTFILMIQPSTCTPLENEKLGQLTEQLDSALTKLEALQSRVGALEVENEKWTTRFGDLNEENAKLKVQNFQQDEEILHLKSQISQPEVLPSNNGGDGPSSRVLSSPPASCQELKNNNGLIPMDGIHLLKNNNKIQAAFCTFPTNGSPVSETRLGYIDIKSSPVYFHVRKNKEFWVSPSPPVTIPFDVEEENVGKAMNLATGIFTAPKSGVYYFAFSGNGGNMQTAYAVFLYVNNVDRSYAMDNNNDYSGAAVSLHATLTLKAGDQVGVRLMGYLYYYDWLTRGGAHFTGMLLEEDM